MTAAGSHKRKKPVLGTTSEHTLVWAAFMLFNSLPQRALCMHYCLYFKKSQLYLQWLSMLWVYRGKQMDGSNSVHIPVTIIDQALFALAKLVQWKWARCVRWISAGWYNGWLTFKDTVAFFKMLCIGLYSFN